MTRIAYISRINLSSTRTNVYNLAKTCEVLNARKDLDVTLITTDKKEDTHSFFQKMGITHPFEIRCLGITSTTSRYTGRRWYEILMFVIANIRLAMFFTAHSRECDVVYSRDEFLFPTAFFVKKILRKKVFFETHSVLLNAYRQKLNTAMVRLADGVIAISSGLKQHYEKINPNIIVSLCSAAEDAWFDHSQSKESFRTQLGLPTGAFLIGYAGVVGFNPNNDCYEVDDIIRSLPSLPPIITSVVVGELNNNAQWLRDIAKDTGVEDRVIFIHWQDRVQIPKYLQAFEVNLIPRRRKDLVGDSPAKMFPALAARRPIIAGRAECIEEVLTDGVDALIVEQNTPEGWAKAILEIYHEPELGERLARQAEITGGKYTWEKRGIAIGDFINRTV